MEDSQSPLIGPPPTEVPLKRAPLIRVIAQVRFPEIASIERRDFIGPFQEAIRRQYPVLRSETGQSLVFSSEGLMSGRPNTMWLFAELKGPWRVVLTPEFVALETGQYTSRDDFMQRLETVLKSLQKSVDPSVVDRIGIRYIDRVIGDNVNDLTQLVREPIAGVMGTCLAEHTTHTLSENLFLLPDGSGALKARWGMVPENATVDLAAIPPISARSWILDLDAFVEKSEVFDVAATLSVARSFTERIYSFFRWAVKPEFLKRYGADPS